MKHIPQIALLTAILFVAAVPASAATYTTISVPTTLSGIPTGFTVKVTCWAGPNGPTFSNGTTTVPLGGGSFQGSVVVVMSKPVASGTKIDCHMNWYQQDGTDVTFTTLPGFSQKMGAVISVTATASP